MEVLDMLKKQQQAELPERIDADQCSAVTSIEEQHVFPGLKYLEYNDAFKFAAAKFGLNTRNFKRRTRRGSVPPPMDSTNP